MRLSHSTRLRLAFLGNAYEFVDCVQDCLQLLSEENLTLAEAFRLLDEMPRELWEHDAAMPILCTVIKVLREKAEEQIKRRKEGTCDPKYMAAVLEKKVAKALVNIIDELGPMRGSTVEEARHQALKQAGEALGKVFGPVNSLFEGVAIERGFPKLSRSTFYTVLPLRADVRGLSKVVMEVLLGLETLQHQQGLT